METLTHQCLSWDLFLEFLTCGGVDTETFDSRAHKTLSNLYHEVKEGDVVLRIGIDGRIRRVAQSVRVLIHNGEMALCEVSREYTHSGFISRERRDYTVSETRQRGERERDAAVRGLAEELNITLGDHRQLIPDPQYQLQMPKERPSSVYPDIISAVTVTKYDLVLERIFPKGCVVEDRGTKVTLKWLNYL